MGSKKKMSTVAGQRNSRKDSGFSLISVLLMGTLAMTWLAASSMTLLPMYRYVGGSVSTTKLDVAAESAADYALALLNDPTTRPVVDPELNGVESQAVVFPASILNQLNPGGTLTATIYKRKPPNASYDPTSANFYGVGAQKASVTLPWRTIEATASLGLAKKSVTVVLRPSVVSPAFANKVPGTNSFFSQSGFTGVDMLWLGSGSSTSAIDAPGGQVRTGENGYKIGGDVATYGSVKLDSDAKVGGRLQVNSDGASKGTAIASGSNVEVSQYLQLVSTSGPPSTQTGFADSSQSNTNVRNDGLPADSDVNLHSVDSSDVLSGGTMQLQPASIPPSYTSPQSAIPHSSTFAAGDTIAGADYSVQSLTISGGTTTTANNSTPARIFVEGNSTDAVQINGSVNSTGNPENLQIWYNGTGTITFDGTSAMNVSAVIYAPNANVVFKSSVNQPVNFTGAINARTISGGVDDKGVPIVGAKNAKLTFSRALQGAPGSSNPSTASLSYSPVDFNVSATSLRWLATSIYENPKEH